MLLLYRKTSLQLQYLKEIYIPLCFYYIGITASNTHIPFGIYIPLCFYYILPDTMKMPLYTAFTFHYASTISHYKYFFQQFHIYLHSTMLLLYPRKDFRRRRDTSFTFHYASTISMSISSSTSFHFQIYIPLCFYYIGVLKKLGYWLMVNLHSTMLLLYPGSSSYLSLHVQFTFHYASTISEVPTVKAVSEYLFTFHYASTISFTPAEPPKDDFTIYIPLCFYYILVLNIPQKTYSKFTFHYASTISQQQLAQNRLNQNLHSTMLLLYRNLHQWLSELS